MNGTRKAQLIKCFGEQTREYRNQFK